MHHQTKRHQHPRQIRRREHQQPQETQPRLRVASAPDVDQTRREGRAEEREGEEGGEHEEGGHGVDEEPGEVGRGPAGRFFQEPRVALEEEDVEEEVEVQRAEVDERREQAPVLDMLVRS